MAIKKHMTPLEKLEELIKICIFYGSDSDNKITKTKLAKLVYLADFAYYYHKLKPITGVEYRKLDQGPVSNDFFKILLNSKNFNIQKKGNAEMCSLKDPLKTINLTKSEIGLAKEVCMKWKNTKTPEIVNFTHKQVPWEISFKNDIIPYSLIIQQDESTLF